jgi:uncharacterized RDD family membrane protein YckC
MNVSRRKKEAPPTFLGHYAGFVTRLVAFVIDLLIISVAIGVMLGISRLILYFFNIDPQELLSETSDFSKVLRYIMIFLTSFLFTFIVNMVYTTFFWVMTGKTIGKAIMGLQVIGPKGSRITFWRALKRYIGYWISALPLFLGYFWVLVNDRRLAWHDKIAGTSVIYDHEAQYSEMLLGRLSRLVPRVEKKVDKDKKALSAGETQDSLPIEAQTVSTEEPKE